MPVNARLEPAALLDTSVFEPLAVLSGKERIAFLRHYFGKRPTVITRLHHLVTLLLLLALALTVRASALPFARAFAAVSAGLILALVAIVPVHESIHAVAYWMFGAPDIRWSLSLRNQIVYVTAHRFVLSRAELMWTAALPSAVITILLGSAIVMLPPLREVLLTSLLFHHLGSRGDWAYLNYLWLCRRREVYAFDDAELGRSYFYVAMPQDQFAAR